MKTIVTLDPTGYYAKQGVKGISLIRACGLWFDWLRDSKGTDIGTVIEDKCLYPAVPAETEFEMRENNILHYSGDLDLHPYAQFTKGDTQMFVYPYTLVLLKQKGGHSKITRMN